MKLWRASWHDEQAGRCYEWCRSKHDAVLKRVEVRERYVGVPREDRPEIKVESVEIPIVKPKLVAWLNAHFTTNNG